MSAIFTLMDLEEIGTVEIDTFIRFLSIHFNNNHYHLRQSFIELIYADIFTKMKDFFKQKDISIKEFFGLKDQKDNKDLLMSKKEFGVLMKIILGKFY